KERPAGISCGRHRNGDLAFAGVEVGEDHGHGELAAVEADRTGAARPQPPAIVAEEFDLCRVAFAAQHPGQGLAVRRSRQLANPTQALIALAALDAAAAGRGHQIIPGEGGPVVLWRCGIARCTFLRHGGPSFSQGWEAVPSPDPGTSCGRRCWGTRAFPSS